jgi:hypothetical protein
MLMMQEALRTVGFDCVHCRRCGVYAASVAAMAVVCHWNSYATQLDKKEVPAEQMYEKRGK